MRALLLALALLAPLAAADAGGLHVHVRVEGRAQTWFDGWVQVPDAYTLTALSGRSYALDARTPLGALWATGLALGISDEFDDLEPLNVSGEFAWDTGWWDYRVDWVQTDYGPQQQWLSGGAPVHPLADGSEVLWYVARHNESPLHLTALGPEAGSGPCAQAVQIQTLAVDENHEAGQPWPPVAWAPAPAVAMRGSAALLGAAAGASLLAGPGQGWAEEMPLPVAVLHWTRSERLDVPCPG
jgi:hypothetical protein